MKKLFLWVIPIISMTALLSAYSSVGEKTASISIIYFVCAVLSSILLIGCLYLVREKRFWFIVLFSSVLIVNIGYTLLSFSGNLESALWANRISYLGSVFLPFSMLMIILGITKTGYKRILPIILSVVAAIVFFIAASPGILDIYYKEVSFKIVDGSATLVKVYGPLHPIYLVYLLGYFTAMVSVIIRASVKKTIDTTAHAVFIAIAVFVNIGVWFIEQLTDIDFEFLSISYIISEIFLMGVHLVMQENKRLRDMIEEKENALKESKQSKAQAESTVTDAAIEYFSRGLTTLTPTERTIYNAYLDGITTKEIMLMLEIKENTLKFHNKNLYGKLGVSSRKQLLEIARAIKKTT